MISMNYDPHIFDKPRLWCLQPFGTWSDYRTVWALAGGEYWDRIDNAAVITKSAESWIYLPEMWKESCQGRGPGGSSLLEFPFAPLLLPPNLSYLMKGIGIDLDLIRNIGCEDGGYFEVIDWRKEFRFALLAASSVPTRKHSESVTSWFFIFLTPPHGIMH